MKPRLLSVLVMLLGCMQVARAASTIPDVAAFIAQQGLTPVRVKPIAMPVSDIVPVMFMTQSSGAPGCGLVAQSGAGPAFIDILRPEPDAAFPQCVAFSDVAYFDLNKKKYLVFEYINRDTKEDFYREYFYVYRDGAGRYVADAELNDAVPWPAPSAASFDSVSAPQAKEGVRRARGTMLSKTVPGMKFLGRDFIADGSTGFAIFHDRKKEACVFVVDPGTGPALFRHEPFSDAGKCTEVLASSTLRTARKSYFLVLFRGTRTNRLAIVSVAQDKTVAAEIAAAAAVSTTSTLTDMKTAKALLMGVLKNTP